MVRPGFLLLTLFVIATALVACGTGGADNTATPEPTSTPGPPSEIEQVIALMPDTAESRAYTRVNHYAAIAEAYGIEIPEPGATFEEVKAYREAIRLAHLDPDNMRVEAGTLSLMLPGEDWLAGLPRRYVGSMPDTNAALGFDTRDVVISAVSGETSPPMPLIEVAIGDFDGSHAAELLDACVMCVVPPDVVQYEGDTYYSWFEDFNGRIDARMGLPLFDHVGRGGRLYVEDAVAARTLRTQDMEAFLDAQAGTAQSLGDNEAWRLAAEAIADAGAVSAVFTDHSENFITEYLEIVGITDESVINLPRAARERYGRFDEIAQTVSESSAELPDFEVLAAGSGWDGEKGYHAMAMVFADEQVAVEALVALRERASRGLYLSRSLEPLPWSGMIESSEFNVDGRVVTGKIYPTVLPGESDDFFGSPFEVQRPFVTPRIYMLFLLR